MGPPHGRFRSTLLRRGSVLKVYHGGRRRRGHEGDERGTVQRRVGHLKNGMSRGLSAVQVGCGEAKTSIAGKATLYRIDGVVVVEQ